MRVEDIKKALEVAETLRYYTDIDANEGANRDVVDASYAACDTIVTLTSTLESLQRENEELRESVSDVIACASDTYKKHNGHIASFEDDSGEKCWIVPFDAFERLRTSLASTGGEHNAE